MTTTMKMAKLSELGQAATTIAFATQVGTQTYTLKRLKPEEHGNRRLRRLFPILASSASQFHHKHLARIFQVDGESIQVLMQFFPETLESRNLKGAEDVLNVLAQTLKGLRYLHEQNALHMNLKPSNLMFEASGNLRLADPLCFSPGSTVSFGINPDYRFFAPAQLDPAVQVSPACDVYGLGMTLALSLNETAFEKHIANCWNETTSEPNPGIVPAPHFAEAKSRSKPGAVGRWSKWHNDYRHPNPSFRALDSSLPNSLVSILDRMLEKDASRRFGTAAAVLDALSEIPEANSYGIPSTPKQSNVNEARNWATGIETVALGGTNAGESSFSNNGFEITAGENEPNQKEGIRLEPDGASWFLDAGSSRRFLVNGTLETGRVAIGHGDILRLGAKGPDLLVYRNETDPARIIAAAREAISRDEARTTSLVASEGNEEAHGSFDAKPTRLAPRSNGPGVLPLILITIVAAILVCVLMYLFAIGGTQ